MANRGGVDLGGTKIQTVIVDAKHKVLGQARRPTPTTGTPADVKDAIAAALVEAADAAGTKAAWRPTPAAPPWRPRHAARSRAAARPTCSRSWRSVDASV